jgi:Ca2+-binding EF-hand superfamily protein
MDLGVLCRLYQQVTGSEIPMESVDIVYAIFDADQDGALAMDEVLGMMNESGRIDDRALEALAQISHAENAGADHERA